MTDEALSIRPARVMGTLIGIAVIAAIGLSPSPAASAQPLTRCAAPVFRGVPYQQYTLRRTEVRAGARIGTAIYWRNYALMCLRTKLRVYRIRGIAPRAAVSVEVQDEPWRGSRRRLLIRLGLCGWPDLGSTPNENRLLRCLRRESA